MTDYNILEQYNGRTITVQTETKTMHCQVLTVFEFNNSNQKYIALIEFNDEGDINDNLLLYRFEEDNNVPKLSNIESDEEFAKASGVINDYLSHFEESHDEDNCGCGCSCGSCSDHHCN